MLTVNNLETYINQFHILQGVSFDVKQGAITVLFGRNGVGKTTTLRSIMGYNEKTSGSITFNNEELIGLPTHIIAQKGIGYVPEDQAIFSSLTVEETFLLAQTNNKKYGAEKAEWMFELFPDLNRLRQKKTSLLSGGQKQMLAISRAYINSNDLLLIDEPSKGLSPIMVEKLMEALLLIKEKTTILLVEQNFFMASHIGDYFHIMDDGKIVHGGRMEDLRENPDITKKYLGIS
ncbi:ABC transporter ATP-binding protein [Sutcliffiella cohnii]|uniref:ABC transporter ATP-binding protein n=1 Tax=Sutcliffiella cohnii TaxID=33932 RepID=A0A223KNB8_9BACI|nr:ABC transporter ATP-binding protein [Sutcliffiella cohnii]AST90896.1 ABC transporter ATP-binding protein [Sutcliffiella cohnii]